jgi:protein-L-isoaspartate O-methyltransferase
MLGHGISAVSHAELVNNLFKLGFISSEKLKKAMLRVDRAMFLSGVSDPYQNKPRKISKNHAVSTPQFHAQQLSLVCGARAKARALDFGCGTGYLAAVMAELGYEKVVATEADQRACEIAERNLARYGAQVEVRLAEKLSETEKRFDAIIVAPYFPKFDEMEAFMEQFLASGGQAAASCLNENFNQRFYKGHTGEEGKPVFDKLMEVACEPMLNSIARIENAASRTNSPKEALELWKVAFQSIHGRKPKKEDLFSDPEGSKLFLEFSKSRR